MKAIFIDEKAEEIMFEMPEDPNLLDGEFITDNGHRMALVVRKSYDKELYAVIYDCRRVLPNWEEMRA